MISDFERLLRRDFNPFISKDNPLFPAHPYTGARKAASDGAQQSRSIRHDLSQTNP
jgi:hypothetical protein